MTGGDFFTKIDFVRLEFQFPPLLGYNKLPSLAGENKGSRNKKRPDSSNYLREIYGRTSKVDANNVYENGMQQVKTKYPNGLNVYTTLGNSGNPWGYYNNINHRLKRITHLRLWDANGGRNIAEYKYNGTSRLAEIDYSNLGNSGPKVRRNMHSTTAGDYDAWDRFGRTTRQQWEEYNGTVSTVDQTDYTYDYAGNRLSREVTGASSLDQTYTYDGLQRLRSNDQSGTTNDRHWKLDQLGNWESLHHNTTGTGTAAETRTHNEANELTAFGLPSTTIDPTLDGAGNMTKIPQASDPTTKFDLVYDVWNRLVEVKNHSGTTVTTNEYDGLNRRIVRDETGGNGKKTHYYYNSQWQVLEERVEVGGVIDPDPLAQYLYHPHYVDSIAMRRYDANTDGLNIEEHYYLQDANFNVTAVTDDTGTVVERYSYTPYGKVTVLDSSFVLRNSSLISNEIQYTGRRLDPETGLQLNRNRFYASHLGRWVNRDYLEYLDGTNLYQYVGNSPVGHLDPLGLFSQKEIDKCKRSCEEIHENFRATCKWAADLAIAKEREIEAKRPGQELKYNKEQLYKACDEKFDGTKCEKSCEDKCKRDEETDALYPCWNRARSRRSVCSFNADLVIKKAKKNIEWLKKDKKISQGDLNRQVARLNERIRVANLEKKECKEKFHTDLMDCVIKPKEKQPPGIPLPPRDRHIFPLPPR